MKISETFASKYLKAQDLNGRTVRVTIASIFSEPMNDGKNKPVIYFQNAQKGLVCNRTNAATIAMALGDDTDGWVGADIELFSQAVSFQGDMKPAIRVRVPAETSKPKNGDAFAATPPAQPSRIIPNAANRPYVRVEQYDEHNRLIPPPAAFDERSPPPLGSARPPAAGGAPFDDDIPF